MILLCFDFGTKNIGVAIGQKITCTTYSLPSIKSNKGIPNWIQIKELLKKWQPYYIIVGLPLNMDGTKQKLTVATYNFANQLHIRFGISIKFQDERLSTVEARARLFNNGGYRALKKKLIDSESAKIILQDWLLNS